MKSLRSRLGKEWLFCDGGTGTSLQALGLAGGELPERWNQTHPDRIRALHEDYLKAGCDIINTNTFGLNTLKFPGEVESLTAAAVHLAQEAKERTGREDAYIALDIGPTGKLLKPMGDLDFEEAVALFAETIRAGAQAGADLVLIETMSDSYESKAAVLAAKENCSLPVLITNIYNENGKLMTGGTPETVVAMLEGLGVDAVGVNCGFGPQEMIPIVKRLTACASVPVIVNPNAGLPKQIKGRTVYDLGAEEFAQTMVDIAKLGVQVVGGCCGTTPDYIKRARELVLKHVPFRPIEPKHRAVICSGSQLAEIGPKPLLIGERINPTGKKRLKQALREHDLNYILQQGLAQEEAGADVLDVNIGLPELDEPAMMAEVTTALQSVTTLPLQLDSSDPDALERGMRLYNGKPMINSVNGKAESMAAVFPLIKKYGGVCVGLALDENGIPDSADGRIAIAKKIYAKAAEYGIAPEDIVIDGLAMTVSSDSRSALITLETIRRVRDELQGHSILGVSNISFGLPQRQIINAHFLTLAMQDGLSCAIMNPNNAEMMKSVRAYMALMNLDENCLQYIQAYSEQETAPPVQTKTAYTLSQCIQKGLAEQAAEATRSKLATTDGLTLINEEMIPALDLVGKGFEKGTIFLPQLLMAAEAAKAAFAVIKESMAGQPRETKGKVILATVKGDIHDIGKNIVKVMLENYGYEVIDLGKDVPPETIVQTAVDQQIKLVGLSALMTTTVVSMEETIKMLHTVKPDTKVVVGGAVLTEEYAEMIHADAYAKDAMATVRYADQVFGADN
ncbi:MAG: homocysteine S-methyltransferase family protein [Catenisphaera adipataccumulans]|jgi:5-methyltetrahydrofolate--homocysteine methyltransferase|uniref:homocysteine S-methyltransferase family protein n=1 Tax=Catenisphaera adipataccumulans TaxID=700500 RepID=UPI003D919224